MQVALAWRRTAAALLVVVIIGVGWVSATAQDSPTHRFFGFLGDVTIDGEAIGPGSTIVARVNGEVVGEAVVNIAGAWILDVDAAVFEGGNCSIVFEVNGIVADMAWETCMLRVRLALTTSEGAASESDSAASSTAADESGDGAEPGSADDAMEGELEEEGEDGALVQSEQLVRPNSPRTGTGGIFEEGGSTNWTRAAAITAVLTLVVAVAALLMSRRTDGTA